LVERAEDIDAGNVGERSVVSLRHDPSADGCSRRHVPAAAIERGLELAHLAVEAGGHDGDFVGKAEILEVIDPLLGLRVAADDGAALEGG
jgi:hypothetical protein